MLDEAPSALVLSFFKVLPLVLDEAVRFKFEVGFDLGDAEPFVHLVYLVDQNGVHTLALVL